MVTTSSITVGGKWYVHDINCHYEYVAEILKVYDDKQEVQVKWENGTKSDVPIENIVRNILHDDSSHSKRTRSKPERYVSCSVITPDPKPALKKQKYTKHGTNNKFFNQDKDDLGSVVINNKSRPITTSHNTNDDDHEWDSDDYATCDEWSDIDSHEDSPYPIEASCDTKANVQPDPERCTVPKSVPRQNKTVQKPDNNLYSDSILEVIRYERPDKDQYFLKYYFKDRLFIMTEYLSDGVIVEKTIERNGRMFELLIRKVQKSKGRRNKMSSRYGEQKTVKLFYLEIGNVPLQTELEKLGNFSCEKEPEKIAARLELAVSPAAWSSTSKKNKHSYPLMWKLDVEDFEILAHENNNTGCGFAPTSFFESYLGSMKRAAVTDSVQVRIFGRMTGWYKGVLMKKPGISKIQLPPSMRKVEKSSSNEEDQQVVVIITQLFPSAVNRMMHRYLHSDKKKPPKDWAKNNLKHLYDQPMFTSLLLLSGVPEDMINKYSEYCKEWECRNHAMLVGVADPTDEMPPGKVFITGLVAANQEYTQGILKIVATRFPCTDTNDLVILECIGRKPLGMSDQKWKFLQSLNFGMIVFGPPLDGQEPIPHGIADGDLDGDEYMCVWDDRIVNCICDLKKVEHYGAAFVDDVPATNTDKKDELLNVKFEHKIGDKVHKAIVSQKLSNELYEVTLDDETTLEMSVDDIRQGRDSIDMILSHSDKNRLEVQVKWTHSEEPTWESVRSLRRTNELQLANYAINKGLVHKRGWTWAAKFISDTEMMKIEDHYRKGSSIMVKVRYDDGSLDEMPMADVQTDAKDLLAQYCTEKGLEDQEEWKWVPMYREEEKNKWLERVQDISCDLPRLHAFDRLTTKLYKLYQKLRNEEQYGPMMAFGKAYKQSVDIQKHGGKVELPIQLHNKVPVSLHKYLTPLEMQKCEESPIQKFEENNFI